MTRASTAAETRRTADFSDQVALIAGACDESGSEIARYLSSRGAAVGLCGANRQALELLAGGIVAEGGNALAAATEGTGPEAIPNAIDRVRSQFGKIDILVNNPSDAAGRSLVELPISEFKKDLDTIVTTSYEFLHEVIPSMREHQYGRIINIYGLPYLGWPAQANLGASYAGIFGLTRSLALETAVDGITVNSVVKGDIAAAGMPAADAEKMANQIPVRRMGTVADVIHAIKFFASPSAKYVTGQTLFVCGGKSAYFSMSV